MLDPEGNPEAWGPTIARHKAWDYLRAAGRRGEVLTSFEKYELLDLCPGPEDEATERRRAKLLWELLDQADLHHRIILVLHEIAGLTLSEIAEREGLKFEAVKTRLRRAREQGALDR